MPREKKKRIPASRQSRRPGKLQALARLTSSVEKRKGEKLLGGSKNTGTTYCAASAAWGHKKKAAHRRAEADRLALVTKNRNQRKMVENRREVLGLDKFGNGGSSEHGESEKKEKNYN